MESVPSSTLIRPGDLPAYCGVCGAVKVSQSASLCCSACRVFFYRSGRQIDGKKFQLCPTNGNCTVNSANRRDCPRFRLHKCLAIGMSFRQRIPARRWRLHQDRRVYLSDSQLDETRRIASLFLNEMFSHDSVSRVAFNGRLQPRVRMSCFLNNGCALFLRIFLQIPRLGAINRCRLSFMKRGLIGSVLLNGMLHFDPATSSLESHGSEQKTMIALKYAANKSPDHPQSFNVGEGLSAIYGTALLNEILGWMVSLMKLSPVKEIVYLLSLLSFLRPVEDGRWSESSETFTSSVRAYFLHLLKMNVRHKYGPTDCSRYYDEFVRLLGDVDEISRFVMTAPMRLDAREAAEVSEITAQLKQQVSIRSDAPNIETNENTGIGVKMSSSSVETASNVPETEG